LSLCCLLFANGSKLDFLVIRAPDNHPLDVDARQVDGVGVERSDWNDLLDFDDADLAACCCWDVEVACSLAEDNIAAGIGLPCFDQCQIGDDPALKDILFAVECPPSAFNRQTGCIK
jgi:hypothetical protein